MLRLGPSVNTAVPSSRRADVVFAAALAVLFIGIMLVKLDLWRHNVLISDWVFMKNILWNTNLSGDILYSETRFQEYGYPSYLNEHFSPLLVPIAFLYKATPFGDVFLLGLQAMCPCLVAVALRGIGLRLFHDRWLAVLMAIAFAFNPVILQPVVDLVYGFHSDSLSPPLIALAAWALLAEHRCIYYLAVVAALLVKENVPAYGLISGALLAVGPRHRTLGLTTVALSATAFWLGSQGIPAVTGLTNRNVGYASAFLHDLISLKPTFDYTRQEALYALRYGGAFLPAFALWPFLAMVVPDLLVFGQIAHANLSSWHMLPVLTILGVLAVIGSRRFVDGTWSPARWLIDDAGRRSRAIRIYWTVVGAAAIAVAPVDLWIKDRHFRPMGSAIDREALVTAQTLVPIAAGVATTTDLEASFAHRRMIFTALSAQSIEYVVVNAAAVTETRCRSIPEACRGDLALIRTVEQRAKSGRAVEILSSAGIRAFRLQ